MLHRRELLLVGAGALAVKATASTFACAKDSPAEPAETPAKRAKAAPTAKADPHAGHGDHKEHGGATDDPSAERLALAEASGGCVSAGEVCLAHCVRLLSAGDTSIAECARAVQVMLAVCRGTATVALIDNPRLAAAAKLCHDVCQDCAEACRPHADHHEECKACLDACEATIARAKPLAAG